MVALTRATRSDSAKPSTMRTSSTSAWYQRNEKPVNTLSWRVLLKEKMTRKASGMYRKANTAAIQIFERLALTQRASALTGPLLAPCGRRAGDHDDRPGGAAAGPLQPARRPQGARRGPVSALARGQLLLLN